MSTPTANDLSKVISNAKARRAIYAVYVIGIVILGGIQVGFAAVDGLATPVWLTVALQVAAYLGIPVGALAAANTATAVAVLTPYEPDHDAS